MPELFSNNSLFVSKLYKINHSRYKLVALACDLIFFTTELQTVVLNNSLQELIYFLINPSPARKKMNLKMFSACNSYIAYMSQGR